MADLFVLPNELLLEIADFTSPSDQFALALTCTRLWQNLKWKLAKHYEVTQEQWYRDMGPDGKYSISSEVMSTLNVLLSDPRKAEYIHTLALNCWKLNERSPSPWANRSDQHNRLVKILKQNQGIMSLQLNATANNSIEIEELEEQVKEGNKLPVVTQILCMTLNVRNLELYGLQENYTYVSKLFEGIADNRGIIKTTLPLQHVQMIELSGPGSTDGIRRIGINLQWISDIAQLPSLQSLTASDVLDNSSIVPLKQRPRSTLKHLRLLHSCCTCSRLAQLLESMNLEAFRYEHFDPDEHANHNEHTHPNIHSQHENLVLQSLKQSKDLRSLVLHGAPVDGRWHSDLRNFSKLSYLCCDAISLAELFANDTLPTGLKAIMMVKPTLTFMEYAIERCSELSIQVFGIYKTKVFTTKMLTLKHHLEILDMIKDRDLLLVGQIKDEWHNSRRHGRGLFVSFDAASELCPVQDRRQR